MVRKNFIHINDYRLDSIKENKIIFDTNILVYLYYPELNNKSGVNVEIVNKIENILVDCKVKDIKIKIIVPVISEFYNLALNGAFNDYVVSNGITDKSFNRKKYRNTNEFKVANSDILTIIDGFCEEFEIEYFDFDYTATENKEVKLRSLDFTDLIISSYCEVKDVCLLTLDMDFRKTFQRDFKFSIISN